MLALPQSLGPARLTFGEVEAVVPAKGVKGSGLGGEHGGNGFVEQRQVMANHEKPTWILGQKVHQPHLGVKVEVVCRFVQQKSFSLSEKNASQFDSASLPPGHR
ncbi:hypothetical protein BMS3Bbin02_01567 [bacterium BMS3Bbin02]|nr:hypothetical protein BMS3Bbin02_01567 [bacterium BMS3Bbin02]